MSKEIWEDVIGYEGLYQVSNFGRVRSLITNIFMTLNDNGKGYLYVNLSINKKAKHSYVHRLVTMAFIENSENKPHVNHKNCIKGDNRLENLEWVTRSENMIHASKNNKLYYSEFQRQRVIETCSGEKQWNSKLSEQDVRQIRYLASAGETNRYISSLFSVSRSAIENIIKRKRWKHVI